MNNTNPFTRWICLFFQALVLLRASATAAEIVPLNAESVLPGNVLPVAGVPTGGAEDTQVHDLFVESGQDQIPQLEKFVAENPDSAWTPSIRAALADVYRSRGRISLALNHWKESWEHLKDVENPPEKRIADHVLASQVELLSSLGRVETLYELLKAADARVITDYNDRRRIEIAHEAYLIMVDHPAISYRCGSLALANVARVEDKSASVINALIAEPSTTKGISLRRLVELNRQLGLGLVAVKRSDRLPVPVPSVIHWAQNHYGAILEYRADIDCYKIIDPTFGEPKWVSSDDLDAEASGYFMVPSDQRPASWRIVSDDECAAVYGRGYPYNINDGRDEGCKKDPTNSKAKCTKCEGMPVWWVTEPYINLWLADEPWSYTTSRDEQIGLRVTVKQRDSMTNDFYYPKPGLLHNWYSKLYIRGMATNVAGTSAFSDWTASLYLGTGGERTFSKSSMYDEGSKTQLQPSYGVLTDGTSYVVPGFPLGTSSVMPPATNWYDSMSGFRVFNPDGTVDRYGFIYWRTNLAAGIYDCEALLTERADPLGNITSLTYESYSNSFFRLKQVTDYDGKITAFSYFTNNAGRLKQVTSPYGQTATFGYDSSGNLTNITDAVSLSSAFAWDANGRVQTLTTPYGTNSFSYYEVPTPDPQGSEGNLGGHDRIDRALTAVDANGGTNLYLYRFDSSSFMSSQIAAGDLPGTLPIGTIDWGSTNATTNFAAASFRNSFFWNPRQYNTLSTTIPTNLVSGDYLNARMQHWLGDSNNVTVVDLISMEREPSADGATEGQKTFYDYAGKPTNYLQGTSSQVGIVARKQPSGNTEYTWSQFNSSGFLTNETSTYSAADGTVLTRSKQYLYATNTVSYNMHGVCAFCIPGMTQLGGCSQPPSTTTAMLYLQGAYNLTVVNTSKVAWASLLVAKTNADQSFVSSGGYQLVSGTASTSCTGGWHEDITKAFTVPLPAKVTNEVGYITSLYYDSSFRLTGVRGPSGLTTTNRYDPGGYLTNTTDLEISATNSFTYTNGLVYTQKNPLGLITTNFWDKLQRLQARYDAEGYVSNIYSLLDLTGSKDKLGNWSYFGYDPLRRPVAITNANQEVTLAQYCQCGSLDWVRDPLQKYIYLYYDLAGRLTNTVYPDGYSVTNSFDSLDRIVRASDPLGTTTNYYNIQGLVTLSQNAGGTVGSNVFDILDRPSVVIARTGVTNYLTYDSLNRLLTNIVSTKLTNSFLYSSNGLVQIIDGFGKTTSLSNDVAGRILFYTNANSELTQCKYDCADHMTNLLDGNTHQTSFQYDQFGRLTNKLNNASASVLQIAYDVNGRVNTRWTPAKGTTTNTYDLVGRVRTNSYPSNHQVVFSYDADGRLTNLVDGVGTTSFGYSDAGQLTSEDGPWSSDTISFAFNNRLRQSMTIAAPNSTPWQVNYQYDAAPRLTNIISGAGAFGYQYHPGIGGSYDSPLWQTLTLPGGTYISRGFDSAGRIQSSSLLNNIAVVLDSHSYAIDAAGRYTNHVRFDNSSIDYTYDNAGQLKTALAKEQGGASRLNEQMKYGYDAAGNLLNRTNNDLVVTFTPDALNQLGSFSRNSTITVAGTAAATPSSVTVKDNANSAQSATVYGDNTFARSGVSLLNGANTFIAVAQDASGRKDTNTVSVNLPSSGSYQYDSNGNLTSDGTRGLDYDDENHLIRVTVTNFWKTEFAYDGLERRRIRIEYVWQNSAWVVASQIQYLYDGFVAVQERDGNNLPLVTYTRGLDLSGTFQGAGGTGGLLARTDHTTVTPSHAFYHADAIGNVSSLVNSKQLVVARYLYDSFGNILSKSGPLADSNLYRFSSKEIHPNSGLIYFGRRFYDPNLQRWLNRDPIQEYGGINLYGYVRNNPIRFVDPYGLDWTDYIPGWFGNMSGDYTGPTYSPPLPVPNRDSYGAQYGFDNDFNGLTGGGVMRKMLDDALSALASAAMMLPTGGEEGAYAAANEALQTARAARAAAKCEKAAQKLKNILGKNLKGGPKGDISGAVSDMVGNPIPKPGGGLWDHTQDLGNILRGLQNGVEQLQGATDAAQVAIRQQAEQAIEQIQQAIKGVGL